MAAFELFLPVASGRSSQDDSRVRVSESYTCSGVDFPGFARRPDSNQAASQIPWATHWRAIGLGTEVLPYVQPASIESVIWAIARLAEK